VQQHAELAGLEVDIAGNVREPLLAKPSLALHRLHFRLALPFVPGKRLGKIIVAVHILGQRDGVRYGQCRALPDRKVGGMGAISG
jgi:hypothetical protein